MSMYYNAGEGLQCVQGCIVRIHYNVGRKAHYNVGGSCNAPGCACIIIVWHTHCNVGVGNITIRHVTTAGLHYNAATWTVAGPTFEFLKFTEADAAREIVRRW